MPASNFTRETEIEPSEAPKVLIKNGPMKLAIKAMPLIIFYPISKNHVDTPLRTSPCIKTARTYRIQLPSALLVDLFKYLPTFSLTL